VATYYDIFGQKVQYISSDPTNVVTGQIWYNSTSKTSKVRGVTTSSAWATGPSMNDNKAGNGAGDSQDSAIALQGTLGAVTQVETYDGTSWTNGPSSSNTYGSRSAGGGSTSASLIGGYTNSPFTTYNATEEYDGSSFSTGGAANTPSYATNTCYGVNNSALGWVGRAPTGSHNEHYNGTAWTTVNPSPPAQRHGYLGGSTSSAIMASGFVPPNNTTVNCLDWDGTSWTSITSLSPGNDGIEGGSGGTNSSAVMVYGGVREPSLGDINKVNFWNGSSWAAETNLPSARRGSNGGTAVVYTDALLFGNSSAVTLEFSAAGTAETRTVTTS
tara:strand:+ start:321 stop:1307 length:987 start_codon:yes stop_codon:yes gene_type:complete